MDGADVMARRLTPAQRRVKRAIEHGGVVRFIADGDDDPKAYYLLLHADPTDPIGISFAERVQTRTLLPLRWRGLLNEDWETPDAS